MPSELASILIGTFGLTIVAIVSGWLAATRRPLSSVTVPKLVRLVLLGALLHACHFGEELIAQFHVRLPQLLGLAPWPASFFVSFNLTWLAIWLLATRSLRSHPRLAIFPIWFLAIASVANGVVHPLLSFVTMGYFPGLWSSPFVGVLGLLIWRTLASATTMGSVS